MYVAYSPKRVIGRSDPNMVLLLSFRKLIPVVTGQLRKKVYKIIMKIEQNRYVNSRAIVN